MAEQHETGQKSVLKEWVRPRDIAENLLWMDYIMCTIVSVSWDSLKSNNWWPITGGIWKFHAWVDDGIIQVGWMENKGAVLVSYKTVWWDGREIKAKMDFIDQVLKVVIKSGISH